MKIVNKKINGINVTFIKTNKFKSVYGSLIFKSIVTKEKMTYGALLRNVLMESTKKYNTNEKLNINTLENYDAYYSAENARIGNYYFNRFNFSTLEDKYTKEDNLKNVLDTFCEIVFNPNVNGDGFDEESFKINYERLKLSIEKRKENQRSYAEERMLKCLDQNMPYTFDKDMDVLNSITKESLYDYYKDMINNSNVSLIIVGNIEDENAFNDIVNKIKNNKEFDKDLYISNDDLNASYKDIKETGYGTQNVLYLVCYLKNMNAYELNYVMPLYRIILGGSGNSRLFDKEREKNSLAYYCFARLEKDDNLLEIITGIEKENYEKSLKIIKEELKKMDKITNEELEAAKKEFISSLLESGDYIENLASRYHIEVMYDLPNIDEFIKKISEVTKEEVENINKKVALKLSYFLKEGEKDGRD